MNKIQQLIIDTYNSKPKHFTQILKRNTEVMEYINNTTINMGLTTFLEKLYYAVNLETNICKHGNVKQLKTFTGYSFCGKTGVCLCAKESVSASVSASKKICTDEENDAITATRKSTSLARYGVTNNGQTQTAKMQHSIFYADKTKVDKIITQIKQTKLDNHGDANFNNRQKCMQTCLSRYGVKNTWSLTDDKQNPFLDILKDKEKIKQFYPRMTVDEIAEYGNVHAQTVYYYTAIHELRDRYKSSFEAELVYFINSLGITNIITNNRTIIGKEIDIYLPDYKLAIEYNGLYYHHDQIPHINKLYHYEKFIKCEKLGIELFSIFGDSWDMHKAAWKEKIKSKLQLCDNKIYARETTVVKLQPKDTKSILNKHHIQGYCSSKIAYGLKYNNEIVAVMTFSNNRIGIGKKIRSNTSFELVRYVTSTTVVGGRGFRVMNINDNQLNFNELQIKAFSIS